MLRKRHHVFYSLIIVFLFASKTFALDAVDIAVEQLDKPYDEGFEGPDSFDCSGLVWYAYAQIGFTFPRTTALEQSQLGTVVTGALQRGDLLFFTTDDEKPEIVTHVGIYEGQNMMINAEWYGRGVRRADISDPYWSPRFLFARRILMRIVDPPWPMYQHNPQQTGHSPDTSISVPLTQRWTFPAVITTSPTIANGVVYAGDLVDGTVLALDAFQGTPKWIYDTGIGSTCWSAALVSGDKVFIASDPGCTSTADGSFLYVLKVNPTSPNGELMQKIPLGPSPRSSLVPPPILFGGAVYVASGNTIWGFDAETLAPVWQSPITIPDDPISGVKYVVSAPAVTQDSLIVGTSGSCFTCKTLFVFDRATGTPKWSAVVADFPTPSAANGLVYVRSGGGGHSGDLIAFDEHTGAEEWRSSVGTGFNRAIPAIASGIVYVASGFTIHAFDAVNGVPVWPDPVLAVPAGSCGFAATIAYSIFAVANDMIFIKSNNACGVAKVYALSTADGRGLWDSGDLPSRGSDTSTPVVANGWLYFVLLDTPTNSGTLYAYSPQ